MKREFIFKNADRQTNGRRSLGIAVAILALFLMALAPQKSYSQTFNPLISFSVESCSLDVALEKLFAEYELNVAFSKAELSKIRIERYSCNYKSVEEVLSDLLKGTDYGFKKVGKQYVIRKNQLLEPIVQENPVENPPAVDPPVEPFEEILAHKTDTVVNKVADTVRIFDTLQIIRTVMRYDTVVRVEQVVKTDTVYKTRYKGLEIHWPKFRDNGWFITPSIGYDFAQFTCNNPSQAEDASIDITPSSAFSLGLDAGHKFERLSVGLSLSYRSLKYRFLLEQTVYDGDYYMSDTLDTYYVVHPVMGDTTYHYILDSVYVPLETTHFSYRDINRLDYLSLGLFASFDFVRINHFRAFVKAGISADFLLAAAGSCNNTEQPFHGPIEKAQAESVRLSYFGGIGAAFKIVNRVELVPEVHYRITNKSLYRADFPFDLRMRMWECRLGLTYYF